MRRRQITTVVLFNRDLRVRDHPALAEATGAERSVVPLFVFDEELLASEFACPNRVAFLLDSLRDLDRSLRKLGAQLVVRRGDPVRESIDVAVRSGAEAIHTSADVSAYARRRERRLREACKSNRIDLVVFPGVTVLAPGAVKPAGGDYFKVFTPYFRRWRAERWREQAPAPTHLTLPAGIDAGRLPERLGELIGGAPSPSIAGGGETKAYELLKSRLQRLLDDYEGAHDDLAAERTSRLSPYLRFGCLSSLEFARELCDKPGGESLLRQLCWRDFFSQLTQAKPSIAYRDFRARGDRWLDDPEALLAWQQGRTGVPVVDAAMSQLAREGWVHNRARMIAASFLVKDLYIDWRAGARHFWGLLVDGDIASNSGNWQWVAGTGTDARPSRIMNPIRQAKRHDPNGDYVRRYVPELAGVDRRFIHEPWKMPPGRRRLIDYPEPLVDHSEAVARFEAMRRGGATAAGSRK